MARNIRTGPPSTKWYSKGLKSGKIIMGRICNPVMMKQEGTVSFGRREKMAPPAHGGMNYNKARAVREGAKVDADRLTANQQLQYRIFLSVWLQDLDEKERAANEHNLRCRALRLAREGVDAKAYNAQQRAKCGVVD